MIRIFDSHIHIDNEMFDEDRDELITRMHEEDGVVGFVNIGADVQTSINSVELSKKYPFVYAAVGVHPTEIRDRNIEEDLRTIRALTLEKKVVAIGEIGLDYYWNKDDKENQKLWFNRQIDMAIELGLPVSIHSREACEDTLNIMKERYGSDIGPGGVIHCFSYTKETAAEYLKMGFYIGIGGTLTYKNAVKNKEVVEMLPIERMVLETDAPYLTPVPFRGKRNDSSKIRYVAELVAELKHMDVQEVYDITCKNAYDLYHIS